MNKTHRNSIYITLLGLGIVLAIINSFRESDKTIPNYATVIGTVCSLVGLAIAYTNIIALKKSSDETKNKIEETLRKVNQLNSLIDISRAIKINQEIQNYIRSEKIELAHLRTVDLKYTLLQFQSNIQLSEMTNDDSYNKLIINIGIDLNSINEYLISKKKLNFSKLISNLEGLSTFLTKFEIKLKTITL